MSIPTFYSDIVRMIIIMSLSGGIVALLLLFIKPLMRHRLPKIAQYYSWIVVLFALLVPISQFFTLPYQASSITPLPIATVIERNLFSVAEEPARFVSNHVNVNPTTFGFSTNNSQGQQNVPSVPYSAPGTNYGVRHEAGNNIATSMSETLLPPSPMALAFTIFLLIYPIGVLLVIAYNLIGYFYFAHKLRRNAFLPYDHEQEMLNELTKGRRTPELLCSELAATPMLIGLLKPTIVLSDREYAQVQLNGILLHELTHMRRYDILFKWVTLFACAVHWFNPLVWLARREINRDCELSCDEAVILNMDKSAKQSYGNTLINVATDTKIPMPVLSTTMCQEKRALKERLSAIMKSKKHTKFAILVSMLIVLLASLGACTLGASRNESQDASGDSVAYDYIRDEHNERNDATSNANLHSNTLAHLQTFAGVYLPTPTANPTTMQDFVDIHIYEAAHVLAPSPHVRVVDSRINSFEHVFDFDHASLDRTIEVWRLDFAMRVEYEAFFSWWSFGPDENGWISNETAFSDGIMFFMFSQDGDTLILEHKLPWAWLGFIEGQQALEDNLRWQLQFQGILPPVDFPGDLSFVYVWLDHGDGVHGHVARFLLSRPIRQGEGGVWMVERVEHLHEVATTPVITNSENRAEVLARLYAAQQRLDSGAEVQDWWYLQAPLGAVQAYLTNRPWQQNFAGILVVSLLPEGTVNPFEIPRHHGPEVVSRSEQEISMMETQSPRSFNVSWSGENCEFASLREQKLAEIGGLAFNEAYHFRTDDGRYALITGWRPLINREEFIEATGTDIPQQIGDLTLVGVTINDSFVDNIIIYNNPFDAESVNHMLSVPSIDVPYFTDITGVLPINEAFTRNLILLQFYAVYVNPQGEYVFMGISEGFAQGDDFYWHFSFTPHEVIEAEVGEVVLIGANDRFAMAYYVHGIPHFSVEIGFADINNLPHAYWGFAMSRNFSAAIPAPADVLIEIVNTINPSAIIEEFGWGDYFSVGSARR